MKEYFKNVKAVVNEVVNMRELELVIPEGFTKELNSMEKTALLNDQLLQYNMMLDSMVIDGCSRIVTASKGALRQKPLSERFVSKRLSEYMKKYDSVK